MNCGKKKFYFAVLFGERGGGEKRREMDPENYLLFLSVCVCTMPVRVYTAQ